jgi:hypothetical protein
VLISIQHVHTITQRDPIPKSMVMKIVAQSLINRGFVPEVDFSFVATPFYRTQAELELHHISMPQIKNVIAVASGNFGVHKLLSGWPILDQKSVFGKEGREWTIRSWGEILRKAIRNGDYKKFQAYAAEGTEQIISFKELRKIYGKPEIEFVEKADVILLDQEREVVRGRVFRYHFPEQSLVLHLRNLYNWNVRIIDLYQPTTVVKVNKDLKQLRYIKTEFNKKTLKEDIYYRLIDI